MAFLVLPTQGAVHPVHTSPRASHPGQLSLDDIQNPDAHGSWHLDALHACKPRTTHASKPRTMLLATFSLKLCEMPLASLCSREGLALLENRTKTCSGPQWNRRALGIIVNEMQSAKYSQATRLWAPCRTHRSLNRNVVRVCITPVIPTTGKVAGCHAFWETIFISH